MQDALPIASKVEPPKELLEWIRSLEEAKDKRATATPVDLEEMQREAREKCQWMIIGSLGAGRSCYSSDSVGHDTWR